MSHTTRELVLAHWRFANARDWPAFAALLHRSLRYEVPQTREYIDSGAGYVEMFRTWPGEWTVQVTQLVCEADKAICIVDFIVDGQTMTGISTFDVAQGLLVAVTDYWPEPYEPPPRATPHLQRRAA